MFLVNMKIYDPCLSLLQNFMLNVIMVLVQYGGTERVRKEVKPYGKVDGGVRTT